MTHLQQFQLKQHLYATARALTEQGNALLEQIRHLPCCPCCPSPPGSTICIIDFLRSPHHSDDAPQIATQARIPLASLKSALSYERTLTPEEYAALQTYFQVSLDALQAAKQERESP